MNLDDLDFVDLEKKIGGKKKYGFDWVNFFIALVMMVFVAVVVFLVFDFFEDYEYRVDVNESNVGLVGCVNHYRLDYESHGVEWSNRTRDVFEQHCGGLFG